MMARFHKFGTYELLWHHLTQWGYEENADGEWWRGSLHAIVSQQKNGIWRYEVV